jgi:hypothetical protein
MILLTAKFTGKNSLGFRNGVNYRLSLILYGLDREVSIKTKDGEFPDYKELRCDYGSLDLFLKNWEIEKIHEEPKISGSSGTYGAVGISGTSGSAGITGTNIQSSSYIKNSVYNSKCVSGNMGATGVHMSVGMTGYSGFGGSPGVAGPPGVSGVPIKDVIIPKLRTSMRNSKLNSLLS